MKKILAIGSLLCALVGSSQAAVIYDESINGDLATFSNTTLTFSAGSNTLLGSAAFGPTTDFDGFLFNIGVGQVLNSVTYRVLNSSIDPNTTALTEGYSLYSGGHYQGASLFNVTLNILSQVPVSAIDNSPFLSPGVYAISPSFLSRSGNGGSWNYEVVFNVTEVPEPGSLALAGLGLSGLLVARRRKQS
jgi:hypothetical protein